MVEFWVQGFNEDGRKFNDGKIFSLSTEGKTDRYRTGPDGKYQSAEWSLEHHISVKQIPGKNNKDITIRTSDVYGTKTGPLYTLSMTQYCVAKPFFDKIREMVQIGGPYKVNTLFGILEMYLTKGTFKQEAGFAEDPLTIDPDSDIVAAVGTWTLNFQEYNKGTNDMSGSTPVITPTPTETPTDDSKSKIIGMRVVNNDKGMAWVRSVEDDGSTIYDVATATNSNGTPNTKMNQAEANYPGVNATDVNTLLGANSVAI